LQREYPPTRIAPVPDDCVVPAHLGLYMSRP
jgi:hypothetical protein